MLLCIDESGNTSNLIALGLTAIPAPGVEPLSQIFTLRPTDPYEVKTLYQRDPDANRPGHMPTPRKEFKYSDFLNAERATGLPVYRKFLKEKLAEASRLPIRTYCSLFDKPESNDKRLNILRIEANTLLLLWGTQNVQDALRPTLNITVDRQVFPEEMLFQVYERRNQFHVEVFPTKSISKKVYYGGRENEKLVRERSSRDFKPLQFTDFVVGAIREAHLFGRTDMLDVLKPILREENIRDARGEYKFQKGFRFTKTK